MRETPHPSDGWCLSRLVLAGLPCSDMPGLHERVCLGPTSRQPSIRATSPSPCVLVGTRPFPARWH